jgi:hypothetical protein
MRKLLVLLSAVAFVVAFTVPAMAADWSFYGSSRLSTFWADVDPDAPGAQSDKDLTWDLQGNSRIGANVKAGDIGGRFEYGTGINLRLLYGTWNFGGGTLLVGQTYGPVNMFYSNQVYGGDSDMLAYGGVYGGRIPMVQLQFGGFKVAALRPATASITGAGDIDTSMPKLEAAYSFSAGPAKLALQVGYNSYDEENGTSESIDSYIAALGFNVSFGAGYLKGDIYTGNNSGTYGMLGGGSPVWDAVNNQVVDMDDMGYLLVAGFKASDALSFEVGYGNKTQELDTAGSHEVETSAYYAQAVINLAKGAFIVPEIGMIDVKDSSETTYYGAKWQINF